MKWIKYIFHYFFGKHKWRLFGIFYKGNDTTGHTEDEYIFECSICHKEKHIKIG